MTRTKKQILVLLAVLILPVILSVLCKVFAPLPSGTRALPAGEGDILFSITTFDGQTETEPFVKCLGHTWLSVENRTGHSVLLNDCEIENGETLTFSIWAISRHRGVVFNLENAFIRQYRRYEGRRSLTLRVEETKLKVIGAYIRENDDWTLGKNCSRWSAELWNAVAGSECALRLPGPLYTPKNLLRAMAEFDCVETDRDFPGVKGIFFYQNGVREALSLWG